MKNTLNLIFFVSLLTSCAQIAPSVDSSEFVFSASTTSPSSDQSTVSSTQTTQNNEITSITFRLRGDNVANYSNHALWVWEDGFDGSLNIFEIQMPMVGTLHSLLRRGKHGRDSITSFVLLRHGRDNLPIRLSYLKISPPL